jgi:hypothetical protein
MMVSSANPCTTQSSTMEAVLNHLARSSRPSLKPSRARSFPTVPVSLKTIGGWSQPDWGETTTVSKSGPSLEAEEYTLISSICIEFQYVRPPMTPAESIEGKIETFPDPEMGTLIWTSLRILTVGSDGDGCTGTFTLLGEKSLTVS